MAKTPAATAVADSAARATRTPLSHERIVAAAVEMMDQEGLAALSMRRLGATLSVQAMSLYGYFPNKDSLITAAGDMLFSQISDPDPSLHPLDGIRHVMVAFYSQAERHPCIVDLLYAAAPARLERRANDLAALETVLGEDAAKALQSLVGFVIGSIHQLRLGGPSRRAAFAYGLDIMIEGLRVRAHQRPGQ
ncbi:TetR/AcrR family transcriptional regulator [Phenylobacterium immobile]|uniref:TetR/AcrR family transcriptional regulator n=1 Tax=Phenylobacterium immobile TaxID=21 RepID=UPI000AFD82AE|nr:TetR/AcrR family transcriptional regulator [Phenylobacterium immobile]